MKEVDIFYEYVLKDSHQIDNANKINTTITVNVLTSSLPKFEGIHYHKRGDGIDIWITNNGNPRGTNTKIT